MISIVKILYATKSVKMKMELKFLFSEYCLKMLYLNTKFHKKISKASRCIERTRFNIKTFKGI